MKNYEPNFSINLSQSLLINSVCSFHPGLPGDLLDLLHLPLFPAWPHRSFVRSTLVLGATGHLAALALGTPEGIDARYPCWMSTFAPAPKCHSYPRLVTNV